MLRMTVPGLPITEKFTSGSHKRLLPVHIKGYFRFRSQHPAFGRPHSAFKLHGTLLAAPKCSSRKMTTSCSIIYGIFPNGKSSSVYKRNKTLYQSTINNTEIQTFQNQLNSHHLICAFKILDFIRIITNSNKDYKS